MLVTPVAGLVLDIAGGNILEVGGGCRVMTVFHGLTQLPTAAVQGLYGCAPLDLVRALSTEGVVMSLWSHLEV